MVICVQSFAHVCLSTVFYSIPSMLWRSIWWAHSFKRFFFSGNQVIKSGDHLHLLGQTSTFTFIYLFSLISLAACLRFVILLKLPSFPSVLVDEVKVFPNMSQYIGTFMFVMPQYWLQPYIMKLWELNYCQRVLLPFFNVFCYKKSSASSQWHSVLSTLAFLILIVWEHDVRSHMPHMSKDD